MYFSNYHKLCLLGYFLHGGLKAPSKTFELKSQNDVKLMTLPFGQILTVIKTLFYALTSWCEYGWGKNDCPPYFTCMFDGAL